MGGEVCTVRVGSPLDGPLPLPGLDDPQDAIGYNVQGLKLLLPHGSEIPQESLNPSPTTANIFPCNSESRKLRVRLWMPELEGPLHFTDGESETGSPEGGAGVRWGQ